MSVTIRTRKGKTKVSYQAVIRDDQTVLATQTFSKKSLAREWGHRVEADKELLSALGQKGAHITFSELSEEYMAQWKGKSWGHQIIRLEWWAKHFGNTKIINIQPEMVKDGLKKLKLLHKDATVNRYRVVLSGCMTFAIHESYLSSNPVAKTRVEPVNNNRIRFLSDDERTRLLNAAKESKYPRMYLLVILALTTGARKSELLGLRWKEIDFCQKTASVQDTKNTEPRMLYLTESVIEEMNQFRGIGNGFVFPSVKDSKKPFYLRREWNRLREEARLNDFVFHDLRHTSASYLAMNGATLHDIAEILGHKSLETTRRYAHLSTDHKANLINRVLEQKLH